LARTALTTESLTQQVQAPFLFGSEYLEVH